MDFSVFLISGFILDKGVPLGLFVQIKILRGTIRWHENAFVDFMMAERLSLLHAYSAFILPLR